MELDVTDGSSEGGSGGRDKRYLYILVCLDTLVLVVEEVDLLSLLYNSSC